MSDVQIDKPDEPIEEGTPEQAEDRVWGDFEFVVVTDPEAERRRVEEFNREMDRIIAEG